MTDAAVTACPSCGVAVAPGDRFCEACGRDIEPDHGLVDTRQVDPAGACVTCGEPLLPRSDGYCGACGMKQPEPGDRAEAVDHHVAAVTDRGRRRPRNEDAFSVSTTPGDRVLAVVCDGVSTTMRPDQASRQAADAALAALWREADERPCADALAQAFVAARSAVSAVGWAPDDELGPPSCTFLAAVAAGTRVELSSMGDCRAFWIPEVGDPETLTIDDSWASDQVLAGTMTRAAASADARSHRITRWLGRDADPAWEPRRASLTATGPGRLVMCSDGLWNYAGSGAEVADLAGGGDLLAVARSLADNANRRGGHDNITVVVVDIPVLPSPKGPVS